MALRTVVMVWIPVGLLALIGIDIVVGPVRRSVADAPVVPVAEPVAVRHVEGDPEAARRRSQPSAVIASELVVPWSTIRAAVAGRADDEDGTALAQELGDVVETLRRTRRAGDAAIPLHETLGDLERLEATLRSDARWIDDARVSSALRHHRAVLDRYPQVR